MSATDAAAGKKKIDRFRNDSGGFLGVLVHDRTSRTGFKGLSLMPGGTIDLDEEEQTATANAPRDPRSNPLANGQLMCVGEELNAAGGRPLRPDSNLATADPADPATWSKEHREAAGLPPLEETAEAGTTVDPLQQGGEQGGYNPLEEFGQPPKPSSIPVEGGRTISGDVIKASDGEVSATQPEPSLDPAEAARIAAERVALETASSDGLAKTEINTTRVGITPPSETRGGPRPATPTPVTATP